MKRSIQSFVDAWRGATGSERGNLQTFLLEFCEALELPRPERSEPGATYCFEAPIATVNREGKQVTDFMDLYRRGHFILEGKQTSAKVRQGRGRIQAHGQRPLFDLPDTAPYQAITAYDEAVNRAFGQCMDYAKALALKGERTPFLIVCDVGVGFHIWNAFQGGYGRYASKEFIPLDDLLKPEKQELFRDIWTNPANQDPEARSAAVTREVARKLGELAPVLRSASDDPKRAARFLMRCVFTFFAEDMGLLPQGLFLEGLRRWEKAPQTFPEGLQRFWGAMDRGGPYGHDVLLRFNGGLFKDTEALPLSQQQIALLRLAAEKDWKYIEPSIFGTLLESALDPAERSQLGAHYTPRAHIQRLVDATFGTDLWQRWERLHDEALELLGREHDPEESAAMKGRLHGFRQELGRLRILDPACGSGNFLYVAYDTLKRIEKEVLATLQQFGETRMAQSMAGELITPRQCLGLELNEWAAAVAELVLWIAHLQWFRALYPGAPVPEPVLQNYGSIQQRDAVLEWSGTRDTGRTRWGGRLIPHRITGKPVPDPADQVPILEYLEPRAATWPPADFIVGNPPFLGNAQLREALGDGYAEALRAAYPEVPDTVDLVLYWWHKAALEVRSGRAKRFGLITTNTLRQVRQRSVIALHCEAGLKLLWAVPDHPWGGEDAAVRIAMTVGGLQGRPWLGRVVAEGAGDTPEALAEAVMLEGGPVELIHPDLSSGAALDEARPLKANEGLVTRGVMLFGAGFQVSLRQWEDWGRPEIVHPYLNGRDLVDRSRGNWVIDAFGLTEAELRQQHPAVYQHLLETVKPERDQNNREIRRKNWWLFGEPNPGLHNMIAGLPRFIATVETAKHRVFVFLPGGTVPDNKLVVIASADAFHLGVLSSRLHGAWALVRGALLEDRPVYVKSTCFDPFPFPKATEAQQQAIRALAEELDAHRKAAQARGVTITQMYNLLEVLRGGQALSEAQRKLHEKALTSLLLDVHQRLDAAVAQAYGWPADLPEDQILQRLVALNAERRAEETQGTVRWLRPEYQAPA